MRALAIEINDAGITIADETGVLGTEPGYAFIDRGRIQTGVAAARLARVRPRQVSSRYWSGLSPGPKGSRAAGAPRSSRSRSSSPSGNRSATA
jgi:hypothetical protein